MCNNVLEKYLRMKSLFTLASYLCKYPSDMQRKYPSDIHSDTDQAMYVNFIFEGNLETLFAKNCKQTTSCFFIVHIICIRRNIHLYVLLRLLSDSPHKICCYKIRICILYSLFIPMQKSLLSKYIYSRFYYSSLYIFETISLFRLKKALRVRKKL